MANRLIADQQQGIQELKGWLVNSQYFYKAEQGRLAPADQPNPNQL